MTTGDANPPKSSTFMRGTARTGSSASRNGSEPTATPDSAAAAATGSGDDDVLERLARLGDMAPPPPVSEPAGLPTIVEADPTYPPLAMASTGLAGTTLLEGLQTMPDSTALIEPLAPPSLVPDTVVVDTVVADTVVSDTVLPVAPAVDSNVVTPTVTTRPSPRPVTFQRRKPRVRRVTRVVRHVDTWSIFKVALVFNAVLYLVCLTAGVLLWNVANSTGTVDNLEKFFEQFGWERFEFKGGELYHNLWVGGLFVAVGLTGLAVLLATIFNLITDLVGGIRVSVLEEEVIARAPSRSSDRSSSISTPGSTPPGL